MGTVLWRWCGNSFREMVWEKFYGDGVETVLWRWCGKSFMEMVWKQFCYGNCAETVLGRWCGNSFITEIVRKQFYNNNNNLYSYITGRTDSTQKIIFNLTM